MEANTESKKNRRINTAIIVVLFLVAGVSIYFLINENTTNTNLTAAKNKLEQQFRDVNDSLDVKRDELEMFRGKNAEMDKTITAQQSEIDAQKKQIADLFSKGKLTSGELSKAKRMIGEYEANIADLQKKMEELGQQNQQLTAQNTQLNTDLSTERTTTTQQKEQIAGLSKKVEVGSLFELRNMDVVAIKKKDNGKEVPVSRAKAAESLKITFETGANKVIDPGPVNLYVRVINPKGETIAVADQGSGAIKKAGTEEALQYTKEADIDYNQDNKKVSVYWGQHINDKGTYKVEVYQNGYLIGKDEVALN